MSGSYGYLAHLRKPKSQIKTTISGKVFLVVDDTQPRLLYMASHGSHVKPCVNVKCKCTILIRVKKKALKCQNFRGNVCSVVCSVRFSGGGAGSLNALGLTAWP